MTKGGDMSSRQTCAIAIALIAAAATVLMTALVAAVADGAGQRVEQLLDAMQAVETGGEKCPREAVGDDGASLGPLQIKAAYYEDARKNLPDCLRKAGYGCVKDAAAARTVAKAYWRRYCPAALRQGNVEVLARIHNGGPSGSRQKGTLAYWRKVRGVMAQRDASGKR